MRKSSKYVIVLCMLAVFLLPSSIFAADKSCFGGTSQLYSKISIERLHKLCNQFKELSINDLKDCNIIKLNKKCKVNIKINPVPAKPAASKTPAAPAASKTPAAPAASKTPAKPAASKTPAAQNPTAVGSYEAQVVELVNKERAAQGLSALKLNSKLSEVAEAKAADMRDQNYFSHTSSTYGSPFDMMKTFGISYRSAGENIAKGYRTPDAVMNGWMNSPGHKANILNTSYTEIGVGYVTDSNGTGYWVQMFIRP